MNKYEFLPDYSRISKLFICSPVKVRPAKGFISEFLSLLQCILNIPKLDFEIEIICTDDEALEQTKYLCQFRNVKNKCTLNFHTFTISDIWIRDYFLCGNLRNENYDIFGLKGIYKPSYNEYYSPIDNAAGYNLCRTFLPNRSKYLPFLLDGGNVISNEEYVLCSKKILTENIDTCSKKDLEEYFKINFKQKLIIIPVDTLDVVGHVDCIARFINYHTLLVPIYPSDYRIDNRYSMSVHNLLQSRLGINYNIEFLPCYLSDNINDDNIFSAEGLYINYLRLEDNIIFPKFACKESERCEKEIKELFKERFPGISIYFTPMDTYALEGGVLNCITNVIYRN